VDYPLVSMVVWFPLLGVGILLCIARAKEKLLKGAALAVAFLEWVLSLALCYFFTADGATMQFVEYLEWIPRLGIAYRVGLDGLSLWLVLLTTLVCLVSLLAGWEGPPGRVRECLVGVLLLETATIGVFSALDGVLFCVFWEGAALPMSWLIGMGADPVRRSRAALKCLRFSLVGSVAMLLAFLYLATCSHQLTGEFSFDLLRWQSLALSDHAQAALFLVLGLSCAVRVPLAPLHTWLADAHDEALAVGSVLLAGVYLPVGAYGLWRIVVPLLPEASTAFPLVTVVSLLALLGIISGALLMMAHAERMRVVAYFSLTQMGYVVLGLFTFNRYGVTGSAFLLVGQGLVAAALAMVVRMRSGQGHDHLVGECAGGVQAAPRSGTLFLIVLCACIGLPGLSTFVGMFLVLLGVFSVNPLYAVFAAMGSILMAAATVRMFRHCMVGETLEQRPTSLRTLKAREVLALAPLVAFIVGIGIYPAVVLKPLETSVDNLMVRLERQSAPPSADLGGAKPLPAVGATPLHRGERAVP
jgi:NADH-quinone oxidoreductase subunit M